MGIELTTALPISDFQILVKSCSIEVQKVKWCMKLIQFKESHIQHMSGLHSWISIRLLNQWWSVASLIPIRGNFIFCWNLLQRLSVNFVLECQICVICENLKRKTPHVFFEKMVVNSKYYKTGSDCCFGIDLSYRNR